MARRGRRSRDGAGAFELLFTSIVLTIGLLKLPSGLPVLAEAVKPILAIALVGVVIGLLLVAWRVLRFVRAAGAFQSGSRVLAVRDPEVVPKPAGRPPRSSRESAPSLVVNSEAHASSVGQRLRAIDWFQFEKLVELLYRANGFAVERRGGAQADGGVDLVATRDGVKGVVQCKHWRTYEVKPDKIRELVGTRTIEGAQKACLITLRGFSTAARQLARDQDIQLIDERELIQHIEELRFTPVWADVDRLLDSRQKTCPRCESPMVERVARRGENPGASFWGCSQYPVCRYVLDSR